MSKKKISPEAQAIVSASDAGLHATTASLATKFLINNPTSQRAWLDLGHALGQLSRYAEAQEAFEKAIELADGDPCDVIFGEIGNLYRAKGDFETAKSWFQKQIDADPGDATGYLFLGNTLLRQGSFDQAIEVLSGGLDCEQGCLEEIHFSIGLALRGKGDLIESKKHFQLAIEMDEKFAAAKTALKDVKSASV